VQPAASCLTGQIHDARWGMSALKVMANSSIAFSIFPPEDGAFRSTSR